MAATPYALYTSGAAGVFGAENSELNYSPNYGALFVDCWSYLKNLAIHRPYIDGVNYKSTTATNAAGVEYNVASVQAGDFDTFATQFGNVNGSSNDNTTAVTNGVVRINGDYRHCQGPTLPDVKSWNVGVVAGPSAVTRDQAIGVTGADFCMDNAAGEMFCDTCQSGGSRYGFYGFGSGTAGGTLHMANCIGGSQTEGLGVIDRTWTPPT